MSLRKILRNINDEKLWDEYAWLTAIAQPVHHGMLFVPIGYTFSAGMFEMEELKGGSPYGSVVQELMLVMVQNNQAWAGVSIPPRQIYHQHHKEAQGSCIMLIQYSWKPFTLYFSPRMSFEFCFIGACIACYSIFLFKKEMFCIESIFCYTVQWLLKFVE